MTEMLPQGQSMPETMTELPTQQLPEYEASTTQTQTKDTTSSTMPEPARDQMVRPGDTQPTTQPIYNGDYVEPQPTVMPNPSPMGTTSQPTTESGGNVWAGQTSNVPTTETSGNVWGQTTPVTETSGNMW